jgi:phage terminase small subunit
MGLTTKQRKFIDAYLESGNATQAAIAAGYSEKTAYSQGARLLKKVEISAVVETRLNENAMSVDEALSILAKFARAEITETFEYIDGVRQPYINVTPENAGSVKKYRRDADGKVEIEMEDRQAAIDKILKVAGAYKERVEHGGEVVIQVKYAD